MRVIIAALHGILTSQTDPSWPDRFAEWMYERDPQAHVTTRRYWAGPFPRWNCWVKDPRLARSLANELELFLHQSTDPSFHLSSSALHQSINPPIHQSPPPPLWFVAHSNGAVIALLAARRLIARGYTVGGLILTGAACEADVAKNGVLDWWSDGVLGAAIAYSSQDDEVLPPAPPGFSPDSLRQPVQAPSSLSGNIAAFFHSALRTLHSALTWPYGCLGRTGWLCDGQPFAPSSDSSFQHSIVPTPPIFTRWYRGGHGTYFNAPNRQRSFAQIYQDIATVEAQRNASPVPGDLAKAIE